MDERTNRVLILLYAVVSGCVYHISSTLLQGEGSMEKFTLAEVRRLRAQERTLYHEFLRVPAMSAGVYELGVGDEDPQEPHTEDELYYIVAGGATLRVVEREIPVEAGSMAYVPAGVTHRFHTIIEDLTVLVFFAPAEYSNRDATVQP